MRKQLNLADLIARQGGGSGPAARQAGTSWRTQAPIPRSTTPRPQLNSRSRGPR
ncbi:hypothetical protein I5Q34_13510 [Streptomyces sp. AV19]|uniref:hypothetical protein n=1 Tax=Streptomyces sp. AV19 TaxID=2793068 RepID=UPI0018FE9980|nr:hypothetical protein [Streptomyces sp. AV19]MBH1935277.1 hypothetical protein [Streptomyces sp. AV19]MDG4531164.1 hypothetical protein [Streptomyces sp. AV19]